METFYVTIGYMENNNLLFQISNNTALIGWILLVFLPHQKLTNWLVHSGILPAALSALYFALIAMNFQPADLSQFSTLEGVSNLFQNPQVLLAGWIHYLAFDLWVGSWIVRKGKELSISHFLLVPLLLLTFLLGPVGFLLFLLLSKGKERWAA